MEAKGEIRQKGKITQSFLVLFCAFIFVSLGLFFNNARAVTTPPSIVTYQGKLLYNSLSVTTTQSIAFILYDALTGGTALYTAAGTLPATSTISVTPSNGLFSVDLGGTGTNALSSSVFQNNATVYLEVVVGGQALSPRKQITSAPYALNSEYLNGLIATSTPTTSAYISAADANGNFSFSGSPQSSAVGGGVIYINPTSSTVDYTLFGVSDNGTQRFRIDKEGDTAVAGKFAVGATSTQPNEYDTTYKFYVNGTSVLGSNSLVYGNLSLEPAPSASMSPPPERFGGTTLSTSYNLNITGKIISGSAGYYLYGGGFGDGYNLKLDSDSSNGSTISSIMPISINSSSTLYLNNSSSTPIISGTGMFTVGGALYASSTLSVGTSTSEFKLTIDGDGGIIARGTYGAGDTLTTAGAGTRMVWYPRKAAFRAGIVEGTHWDEANIGGYSAAFGKNTTSSGFGSLSFGFANEASGLFSFAGGGENLSTGSYTFAYGSGLTASGNYSTAFGSSYVNNNDYSLSVGNGYVDNLINAAGDSWFNLNTGNVGIGTSTPSDKLTVAGTSYFTGTTTVDNLLLARGKVANPVHKGKLIDNTNLNTPRSVAISGNYAYIAADFSDALTVVDISDPSTPVYKGKLTHGTDGAILNEPVRVVVSGNYAYVVSVIDDGVEIVDISDPANPRHKGKIVDGAGGAALNDPYGIAVSGNYLYVVSIGSDALEIVDISDPANPIHKGKILNGAGGASINNPFNVVVSGNYAYLASYTDNALEIVDISDPANPIHKGKTVNSVALNQIYALAISGKYVYAVGQGNYTMAAVDVSNPSSPTTTGYITHGDGGAVLLTPSSVALAGNYAYVSSYNSSALEIINISNPASPQHAGKITNGTGGAALASPEFVALSGNYAYVASSGSNALEIVDVSGASITNTEIGTARANNLQVMNMALFDQSVNIRGGLSVGANGLLLSGNFGMSSPTSTNNITTTNTLSFSHTALFKSSATTSESNLFIFDTNNAFSTANSSTAFLLSVRNNGTSKFSVASNGDVAAAGNFYAASINVGTPGNVGDLSERVDIAVDDSVEPGDVLMVDPMTADTYRRTAGKHEQSVAGVVSTNPVIIVGNGKTDYTAVLAMVGRVPVKVSDENGPIQRGDLLVSASKPGYAMKYNANKDDNKMVGIIGVALESLTGGTGKIMSLIRTGWANSYTESMSTLRQNIQELASSQGISINTNPVNLNVENQNGQLVYSGGNLNMQGNIILNVASIAGKNDRWSIDANGHFITRVDTSNGKKEMYSMQSPVSEFVFSSSSQMIAGEIKIDFDTITKEIIDFSQPLKINVTLTSGEAKGVYVSEKNSTGFVVKELGGGTSNASFDWMVVAKRKDGVIVPSEVVLQSEQPVIAPETGGSVNTTTVENVSEITTSTVLEVVVPVPETQMQPQPEPQPQPEAVLEPVTIPAVETPPIPVVEPSSPTPSELESTPVNP